MIINRHCAQCGKAIGEAARFCVQCGAAVAAVDGEPVAGVVGAPARVEPAGAPLTAQLVERLAGPNGAYYGVMFQRMYPTNVVGIKPSWNWASALGGSFWLLYRRLYREGAFLMVFMSVLGFAGLWSLPVALIINGVFGNAIYFMSLERRVMRDGIRLAGGVNRWAKGLAVALYGGTFVLVVVALLVAAATRR